MTATAKRGFDLPRFVFGAWGSPHLLVPSVPTALEPQLLSVPTVIAPTSFHVS